MDQALVNPPPLKDENIRDALLKMTQAITTQAQDTITQPQAMRTQANQEVVPRANQKFPTMDSCLRDLT